jgi:hypothetical protein
VFQLSVLCPSSFGIEFRYYLAPVEPGGHTRRRRDGRQEYGSYCYRPKGSSRFWFRFQYPKDVQEIIGRRKVEFALQDDQGNRTTDPQVAELLALPHITHHKLLVHEARNRLGGHLRITIGGQRLQPGEHVLNGKTVIATDDTIFVPREPATLNALWSRNGAATSPVPMVGSAMP